MGIIATYDGKIFHNPSNKFCIVIMKTEDTSVPAQARDKRRYGDHLIRFTAVGYEIPMTDAVELELDGEWVNGKYGMQLQVSDGELRETQMTNYFSNLYPIDCAVLSVNAQSYRKYGTLPEHEFLPEI